MFIVNNSIANTKWLITMERNYHGNFNSNRRGIHEEIMIKKEEREVLIGLKFPGGPRGKLDFTMLQKSNLNIF